MKNKNVAIIGRPNVGKSTLFNRLIQRRLSITSDISGTTRDRLINKCEWLGRYFYLVDTGGYTSHYYDSFQASINDQVEIAIDNADIILLVVSSGQIMREDEEIANKIRRIKDKKVILVVNKIDNKEKMDEISQFYNLGLGEPIGVSSIHGIGINDLLDSIVKDISQAVEILDKTPKIGIIGKPNVGKSTLLNKITKDDRMIVSEVAGTTRDAVDTRIKYKEQEYIFTDTAGIKKNKKTLNDIEFYAEIRANLTIETATIVLLLIDLSQGISKIDERLIGVLKDKKKPTIIVVNKADLLDPEDRKEELRNLEAHFDYATYMPIIFISAETGRNIPKLFEMFDKLEEERTREINKHQLNEFLIDLIFVKKPPRHNGIEVKLKYITFVKDVVPHFIIFSNKPEFLHFSYQRFIEKQIRIVFNLQNIPVKISLRSSYGK